MKKQLTEKKKKMRWGRERGKKREAGRQNAHFIRIRKLEFNVIFCLSIYENLKRLIYSVWRKVCHDYSHVLLLGV